MKLRDNITVHDKELRVMMILRDVYPLAWYVFTIISYGFVEQYRKT